MEITTRTEEQKQLIDNPTFFTKLLISLNAMAIKEDEKEKIVNKNLVLHFDLQEGMFDISWKDLKSKVKQELSQNDMMDKKLVAFKEDYLFRQVLQS